MSNYYVVKCIKDKGVPLNKLSVLHGYEKLKKNDHIVAIMNNGLYAIAPDVTKKSDFKAFDDAYRQGYYLSMDLYKVSEEALGQCQGQGRDYHL